MTTSPLDRMTPRPRRKGRKGLEYRLIHSASFGVFFIAACGTRVFSTLLMRPTRGSPLKEARDAAGVVASYAFMG